MDIPIATATTALVRTPLDKESKQIRLLLVRPLCDGDEVTCHIKLHSLLNGDSTYEAVSYAWSHVKGKKSIVIDDEKVEIPAAAEEVIRYLRYAKEPRVIWVDAICINQEDIREKGHQIALMHEIYKTASRTVVWLGQADEATAEAFRSLELVHGQMSEETDGGDKLREVLYGEPNIFQYSKTALPTECNFAALKKFCKRVWFRRLWVVQEVVLASTGVVYCGVFSMPLIRLARAAVWVHHKQHSLPFDLDAEQGMLNASYMSAYIDKKQGHFSRLHGPAPYLADLFRYFHSFRVSEPRDKVYAILGLTRFSSLDQALPASLVPNYEKPLGEVLVDATRMTIQESGDLWILRHVEHGTEFNARDHSPSWIPILFREPCAKSDPNPLRSTFRANRAIEGHHSITELLSHADQKVLLAKGIEVGVLQTVGKALEKSEALEKSPSKSAVDIQILLETVLVHRCLSTDDEVRPLARFSVKEILLTLVGGTTFDSSPQVPNTQSPNHQGGFDDFVRALTDNLQVHAHNSCPGEQSIFASTLALKEFSRHLWAIRWACTNRRIFVTATGQLGLGPWASQVGDSACIMSGSRVPMILRRSIDSILPTAEFAVIGPCYIHGAMQGEVGAAAESPALRVSCMILK
ncbi:hypothetical protein FHL15_011165 [Xylaria flabelliformis]|uniref:Heterokaryon incompatibility domain-containing protein n=1 Tax=Xylaria flabelliformis TaxID=2512241 RepID=A0A553HJ28_9PEZI|nr:hypothetical protein FHL15_011165 [Xylaria flabelliformis]